MSTKYLNAKNGIEILTEDVTTQILSGNFDPSIEGQPADIGSLFLCTTISGGVYNKIGEHDFDWDLLVCSDNIDGGSFI